MAGRNKKKVGVINLDSAIREVLKEYGDEVYQVLGTAIREVSDEAERKLGQVDHFAPGRKPSGAYSRDWTSQDERTGRLAKKRIVFNADHYRLTHLLEKGHVSRNGTGRTFGRVQAYPHIKPVEEWAQEELLKRVEQLIKTL